MLVVLGALVPLVALAMAHPFGVDTRMGAASQRVGWLDVFAPYIPPPETRKSCFYKDGTFEEGSFVPTEEPCLKCRCLRGALVCYLRVCPRLPDPPPRGCVLLLRRGACCSELICQDGGVSSNHIARSEPASPFPPNVTSYRDGCISNGTLYASGSAMWTSRRCEYCYCIEGKERCVRPRCLPPQDGCTPRESPHSCCPVRYDCIHNLISSTTFPTLSTGFRKGCTVENVFYPEGDRITSVAKSPCDNCFCMKGIVRCVPLSCAPPLMGCTPVINPGDCCATSYNCSRPTGINKTQNRLNSVSDLSRKSSINRGTIVSERSFPGDTSLTPSEIADILLYGDEKIINRKVKTKRNESDIVILDDLVKSTTKVVDKEIVTNQTDVKNLEVETVNITLAEKNKTIHLTNKESTTKRPDTTIKPVSPLDVSSTSSPNDKNHSIGLNVDNIILDSSKTLLNDSVNCTTEINENSTDVTSTEANLYNDTQERILPGTSYDDDVISADSIDMKEHSNGYNPGSKFPSTSFIIPKDDDVFMVNVSTHVNTNSTVVTLKPIAAIPPEIEALLNISLKKNGPKDDFYDYDYKSVLPPSLPNLEIIPFLAVDAVPKTDPLHRETEKEIDHYATAEPPPSSFLDTFTTIPRNKYNATAYASYDPPSEPASLLGGSYNTIVRTNNPVVYKQHINDKFNPTTYNAVMLKDKYDDEDDDVHYGSIDKFDATVYPQLTGSDAHTEDPALFAFGGPKHSLFSPPVETEGGFLPKDPHLLNTYYHNLDYSTTDENGNTIVRDSLTDRPLMSADDCISNGRRYKNRELITEANACVVCYCYYGDIHCQDPECPPIKPDCKRIIEKDSTSCCGIEICEPQQESTSIKYTTEPQTQTAILNNTTPKPFKTIPYTEKPTDLQSLIDELFFSNINSTMELTTPTTTSKPSTHSIGIEYHTPPTPVRTTTKVPITETTTIKQNPTLFTQSTTIATTNDEALTDTFYPDTSEGEQDSEDEGFSFQSLLNIFLGDSETTTTTRPTRKYTTIKTTSTTSTPISIVKATHYQEPLSPKILNPTTTTTTTSTTTTTTTTTKPTTTQKPIKYKPIYSTPQIVQPHKKIPYSQYFTTKMTTTSERPVPIVYRKPTLSADSTSPFATGLLKLAGCNIYGRMYRVGRIISELSGPCLECMCTEVGVQCKPLTC